MSVIRNLLLGSGKQKLIITVRAMSSKADYLVNHQKYSFLTELGLTESNYGVYDGAWKGSGKVHSNWLYYFQSIRPKLSGNSVNMSEQWTSHCGS